MKRSLEELVRPNIWKLKPYSSARDEFHGTASVYLDANENPFSTSYNRYPDPMQWHLKERISALKGVDKECIFLGNGSDEAIDLVLRIFCDPGIDRMVTISPSYGMYEVAADINNVACVKVSLNADFSFSAEKLLGEIRRFGDNRTKVVYLCSPNNPSGNLLERKEILTVLNFFDGIVVVDEAYIDFAAAPSFLQELDNHRNLVVLQTLSKAWGGAGLRLGMGFASKEIIALMNRVKYPYNVNQLTQEQALNLLNRKDIMQEQLLAILKGRKWLAENLGQFPFVKHIYPSDANFLLVRMDNADAVYAYLVDKGIIVRSRTKVMLCDDCLRITVGTPEENRLLIQNLQGWKH